MIPMMRPLLKLRRRITIGFAALALAPGLAPPGGARLAAQQLPPALPAVRLAPSAFGLPGPPPGAAIAGRFSAGRSDLALTAGLSVVAVLPGLLGDRLPYATCAPCDSTGLWGPDRRAIGAERVAAGRFSDASLAVSTAGAGLLLLRARRGEGDGGAAARADLAVLAQALAADAALTEWLKVLFHRARPVRYTADAPQHAGADHGRSFPSTHASLAFTAASAATTILVRRGAAGGRTAEIAGLFGAAALTAGLRVAAHRHFPTDVAAGAALGTLVGWSIPRLRTLR